MAPHTICSRVIVALLVLSGLAGGRDPEPGSRQLIAPWYTLWNKIKATVGRDPGVWVENLDTSAMPHVVNIRVEYPPKASALAALLIPRHEMGNITVAVRVTDSAGTAVAPAPVTTAAQLAEAVQSALATNELFVTTMRIGPSLGGGDAVGILFAREVVQFPSGDLSEIYGNYNGVAAQVFREVLSSAFGELGVRFGTQRPGAIQY